MSGSNFLSLDPTEAASRGRTTWLAARLRSAIVEGELQVGSRLPATRALADELAVARGTVVEAYRRLTEEGLLVSNRGGGTTVARVPAVPAGVTATGAADAATPRMLDISAGVPDVSAFPRAAWLRVERRVLAHATEHDLGYSDPQGVLPFRRALAGWLARSRGIAVPPERIIITAGVTGALSTVSNVLRARGITECAVEDPGADGNRRILEFWLDRLHPIPVDADGLDVSALAATGARVVLVTPAHHFPSGVVLSPTRRRELIAWAERTGGLVIEDDYDSEYRYDRAPVRAMHATAPEQILHISSLSKVLAPALRIGWMIAPEALHEELVSTRWATDLGSPVLPQLVLAELIESGALERHLRVLRTRHRQRRDAAVEAVRRYLPGCEVGGIAAGLHLVVTLPAHLDETRLVARARETGIAVQGMSAHRLTPGASGLVIGYGPHPTQRLADAIRVLGALAGFSPGGSA